MSVTERIAIVRENPGAGILAWVSPLSGGSGQQRPEHSKGVGLIGRRDGWGVQARQLRALKRCAGEVGCLEGRRRAQEPEDKTRSKRKSMRAMRA